MEDGYAAIGEGGNVIYINTKNNIVVAITSSFMTHAKDRIELIKEKIMPLFCYDELLNKEKNKL